MRFKKKNSYPLILSTNEINSNFWPPKNRGNSGRFVFHGWKVEVDAKGKKKEKKKGKSTERVHPCMDTQLSCNVIHMYVPLLSITWWYIDLKPRCYAGSEERVWSRTM